MMTVFRCKMCGGTLEINENQTTAVCEYCGTPQTLPKTTDESITNLFNRANILRQKCEFDKAEHIYEKIVEKENNESEAYWGMVLCRYGIEYVEDPNTLERIPTCHRTLFESVITDTDFLLALDYSDFEQRKLYEAEAHRIDEIQKGILNIVNNEEAFDVFICYKETDENGSRTIDSTIANDIYYQLKQKGLKVFYAAITLEEKLGKEYEPYIFSALNSAKVMLVVGTKPEYFNSVWVKNEWSRFLKFMKADYSKLLIPCYRDMDAYELPEEFARLQAMDMSKIGFINDLIHGIEKCMRGQAEKKEEISQPVFGTMSLDRLLQNSVTYLKLNNFAAAEEVFTTVTKDYPEEFRGWWGLIVCKTKNFSEIILDQAKLNVWFQYVKQLSSPNDFAEIENQYVNYTEKVSHLAAIEDMKQINNLIDDYNEKIHSNEKKIQENISQIKTDAEFWDRENDRKINGVKEQKKNIAKIKKEKDEKTILLIFIFTILFVSVFLFITEHIFWGIISVLVNFCFVYSFFEGDKYKKLDERLQNAIKKLQDDEAEHIKNMEYYDDQIDKLKKRISKQEALIPELQMKITYCRKYLELGKQKISEYWFSKKCEEFNVYKPFDRQILELRNAAVGVSEKPNENDMVTFTCPVCGVVITESRNVLMSDNYVVCEQCGYTMEVNLNPQS